MRFATDLRAAIGDGLGPMGLRMIDLGPNDAAFVAEVLELAERGPLLAPRAPLPESGREIVHTFDEARDWAYHRLTTGGVLGDPGIDDDDAFTWTDLREHEVARIWEVVYRDPAKAGWDAARSELEEQIRPRMARLPAAYQDIVDDIAADLTHCVLARAAFGVDPDSLFEKVWLAYRDGGWPCGWAGRHPVGRLVVYEPR